MKMKITLHGVSYEVDVEVLDEGDGFYGGLSGSLPPTKIVSSVPAPTYKTTPTNITPEIGATKPQVNTIAAPVAGTIIEVKLKKGDNVKRGDEIMLLEAMKMHTSITSPIDGVIKNIPVAAGDNVKEGQVIVEF